MADDDEEIFVIRPRAQGMSTRTMHRWSDHPLTPTVDRTDSPTAAIPTNLAAVGAGFANPTDGRVSVCSSTLRGYTP
jgi:hypothetical protein